MTSRDFIYIHIPKTGGRSVKAALNIGEIFHFTALYMKRRVADDFWKESFKFCFVRNPWDRMVSWFYFNRNGLTSIGKYKEDFSNIDQDVTFDEWIKNGPTHNWNPDWLLPEQVNYPFSQFVFCMDQDNKPLVDFIGRFENFQEDFRYVLDNIGRDVRLPKLNVTSKRAGRHYHEIYTSVTKEIVGKMFEEEIDYFGYQY